MSKIVGSHWPDAEFGTFNTSDCSNFRFSILVPTYKQNKNYVINALESAINQKYDDFEIVICEQGDDDLSWIKSIFPIVRIVHQDKPSLYQARVNLLKSSRGEFVIFLDSDDCLSKFCLSTLNECINKIGIKSKQCVFAYKMARFSDNQCIVDEEKCLDFSLINVHDFLNSVIEKNGFMSSMATKCFPKSIFRRYIATDIFQAEDKLLSMQLLLQATFAVIVNLDLYFYRLNEHSGQHAGTLQNLIDLAEFYYLASQLELHDYQICLLLRKWPRALLTRSVYGLKMRQFTYSDFKAFICSDLNSLLISKFLKYKNVLSKTKVGFKDNIAAFIFEKQNPNYYRILSKIPFIKK